MKQPTSHGKKPAKSRRETREELNQSARDRKRQKKHRGNAPGSRAGSGQQGASGKKGAGDKDPRIGSKKPVELGAKSAPAKAPVVKKVVLSPREELDKLERDDKLDGLLERLENGETLSADEQSWVDAQLDRIDELMQQLGLSYDDDEEEGEEEAQEDMMRLLRGGN